MKKICVIATCLSIATQVVADNDSTDLRTALTSLTTHLDSLANEVTKPPVPPRDDHNIKDTDQGTPPPPPAYDVEVAKTLTTGEEEQLKRVLKNLVGDEFLTKDVVNNATSEEFLHDMTAALFAILQGFDYKTGEYIGYPTYSGKFLARFLQDYDNGVALIRVASPQDKNLKAYDKWRTRLVNAVGKLPSKK